MAVSESNYMLKAIEVIYRGDTFWPCVLILSQECFRELTHTLLLRPNNNILVVGHLQGCVATTLP